MGIYRVNDEEIERRQNVAREQLVQQELDALIVFATHRIYYLSNFTHVPTERPVAFVLPVDGPPAMLVPALEEEHARARVPSLKHVAVYAEYPGSKHPMLYLAAMLKQMGLEYERLGADSDGYGDHMGYRGPTLSAVVDRPVTLVRDLVDDLRLVKSEAELALLRTAGRWAVTTHRLLQTEMQMGRAETDISRRAEWQSADQLTSALANEGHLGGAAIVHASFRAGPRTAMPHAMMGTRELQRGDNVVSYCLGTVAGYYTELERTMFVGEPSERQREFFSVVQEAQQLAFSLMRPGAYCREIDSAVHEFLVKRGYGENIRHHTGHGLGLEFHERPFFDIGDETVLQAGMVFSVEPGLYLTNLGGFRHSDTVALTEMGVEVLTEYPRSIEDLIISA